MTHLPIPERERFPWDSASEQALIRAAALDPADQSWAAEYLREVAGSVAEHRQAQADNSGPGAPAAEPNRFRLQSVGYHRLELRDQAGVLVGDASRLAMGEWQVSLATTGRTVVKSRGEASAQLLRYAAGAARGERPEEASCPAWCDGNHRPGYPVHTTDVGEVGLPGGEQVAVSLFRSHGEPVKVWAVHHQAEVSAVLEMDLTQAHSLYDLLGDALVRAGVQL